MPKARKPSYLLHRPTGQAYVRLNSGENREFVYLGEYGSPESRERYDDVIAEWFAKQGDASFYMLDVSNLSLLFMEYAENYYRKNGKPTSEVQNIRVALRPLIRLHGSTRAREFSPRKLKAVRQAMIDSGCVRTSINRQVGHIARMFRWAVQNEYVPVAVYSALTTVPGLRSGRSKAKESRPVKPVSEAMIESIEPFVTRQVWGMVQLQVLTGMRPGEVISMRGCDLNMAGRIWEYRPESHKTEHHGKERVIFIGPQAQDVVRPFLKADLSAFLFSPRDARNEFDSLRRENRKTPMTPSQKARKTIAKPKKQPGEKYTVCSYRQAVAKACEKAFDMPKELRSFPKKLSSDEREQLKKAAAEWRAKHLWHPHQLRHTTATAIRREFGTEAAQVVLGHSNLTVTEVYAERDFEKARSIIAKIG